MIPILYKQRERRRILLVSQECLFFQSGCSIENEDRQKVFRLPVSFWCSILMRFHLLSRTLRLGVHHLIRDGTGGFFVVYNKFCARFSASGELIGAPVKVI